MISKWAVITLFSGTLVLVPLGAQGWQVSAGARLGLGYSDNIGLAERDAVSEAYGTTAFGVNVHRDSQPLSADITSIVEHRAYNDGEFSDETLLDLDATGSWRIVPGRLIWHISDVYRQALEDPLAAPRPDNRQTTNLFSTGPDVIWPLSGPHTLESGVRYTRFDAEVTTTDYDSFSGYGRWRWALDRRTLASANIEVAEYRYERASVLPDSERLDLFVSLGRRYPTASVEVDVGSTRIDREGFDDLSGSLFRLGGHWDLNSRTVVRASHEQSYTIIGETPGDFLRGPGAVDLLDDQITGNVYRSRSTHLGVSREQSLFEISLSGSIREERYQDVETADVAVGLDREVVTTSLDIGYPIRPALTSGLFIGYREADYTELDEIDRDWTVGARFDYRVRRLLTTGGRISHRDRDSTIEGGGFTENRVEVFLTYGYWPGR